MPDLVPLMVALLASLSFCRPAHREMRLLVLLHNGRALLLKEVNLLLLQLRCVSCCCSMLRALLLLLTFAAPCQ